MDEATKAILATIYGEAAQSSPGAWRAIASVILNRVGYREWRKYLTPLGIVANTGFDAFTQENPPYKAALRYLEKGTAAPRIGALVTAVLPILQGTQKRTTDAVLYYSPKAQAALHEARPDVYRAPVPRWNMDELLRVYPEGVLPSDDFAFFRYRRPFAT